MKKKLLLITTISLLTTAIIAQDNPKTPTPAPQKDMSKLEAEYGQIKQKLQNIQNQALQNEKLLNESLDITKKIDKTIIAKHPDVKEKVKKRASIREKYEEKVKDGDPKVLQKLQGDFQAISKDLVEYDKEASQDKKIVKLRMKFQQKMIQEMVSIEPKTKDYLQRLREIETIAAQMQQQQGG
jgi:cellulose biosynthesis protein BcsQ